MLEKESLLSKIVIVAMITFFAYNYFTYVRKPNLTLDEIKIESLSGQKIDINDYKGKPLIVNFWASWCAPCLKELPHFIKIKEKYGEELIFLLISEEESKKIIPYQNKLDFDFVRSSIPFKSYSVNTWPTTYFYDVNGNLVNKHSGSMGLDDLQSYVDEIK